MGLGGPVFYDDDAVFATYQKRRARADAPNDTMEGPEVADMLGDVAGRRVLDLGCGDGAYGKELLANIYRTLAPGGRLVFSAEHPVITSCNRALEGGGPARELPA